MQMEITDEKFMLEWNYLYTYITEDWRSNDMSEIRTNGKKFVTVDEIRKYIKKNFVGAHPSRRVRNLRIFELNEIQGKSLVDKLK